MKDVLVSLVVAVVLTSVSYAVGIWFGWIEGLPWLEIASVFTSYSCTYLCVRESRWNFPIGIVSVILLSLVFYNAKLYSSMVLSLYLVPVLIFGWWCWSKDAQSLAITHLTKSTAIIPILTLSFVTYAIVTYVTTSLGGTLTWFDAGILVLSILAQYMLTAKIIESWFVWVVVNVLAIYTYFSSETYLVAMQYIFFLANTVYGYTSWKRSITYA